jgi:type IV pilus assembly protein PilE
MRVSGRDVRRSAAGFTLIELMITVLVVALLAAVGFPSYQDHVRKAKRAEGKSALMRAAQLEERWYTTNQTYTTDLGPLFGLQSGAAVRSGEDDPARGNYNLTIAAAAVGGLQQGYTLIATPNTDRTSGGGFDDPDCNVLTLSSTGVRTYSGTTTRSSKDLCW